MSSVTQYAPLLAWLLLCTVGGCLLVAGLFRLRRAENGLVGFAVGLLLETWLANLLAHVLPVVVSFWLSAALVCLSGLAVLLVARAHIRLSVSWRQWALFGMLTLVFTLIGRGLGIFDDYQNLPTISLMAAGDIPPHFALDPSLNFGYHYFLLLLAAQLMRLGDMFPWTALDVARGAILALPLVLSGLWAYRLTRSHLAATITGAMLAFAGGARWLLLLLPTSWVQHISGNIELIGSASTSAPTLADALLTNWKIDGAGPIPFPFAFYTGINQPYVMAYTGISGSGILILLLLLLLINRTRHWSANVVVVALLAALAMANEIAFLLLMLGILLIVVTALIQRRSGRLPAGVIRVVLLSASASVVAALQGGLLTEILRSRLLALQGQTSYFDTSLTFVWPPAIVSAHLGSLSLGNPAQLVAALAEIGPVILVTPLVLLWGWKSYRLGNWYEASLIAASAGTLVALFVAFKGPLFTATPRLMSSWFFACILYWVPLLWIWARRRTGAAQALIAAGTLAACLSGLVLFAVQLPAMQRPVLATFITPLDARMTKTYWNKLNPGALIFDPVVFRAPTVFARFTDSSPSWYSKDPEWEQLAASPDPAALRAAGYSYVYLNKDYWDSLSPAQQSRFGTSCVTQVAQVDGIHSEQDYTKDFRRLLDISACQ
jgi:hypothetical protein